MRGFSRTWLRAALIAALAVGFWTMMGVSLSQAATAEKPAVQGAGSAKVGKRAVKEADPTTAPSKPAMPLATEVELQRRVDGLASEMSFELKDMIGWGIGLLTLLVTLLGIIVVILIAQGYFSKSKGEARNSTEPVPAKEHEAEARRSAEDAKQLRRRDERISRRNQGPPRRDRRELCKGHPRREANRRGCP